MNCPLCGAELKPYESLCAACREKQQHGGNPVAGMNSPLISGPGMQQNAMQSPPEQDPEADLPAYLRSGYTVTDEPGKTGIFKKYKKQIIISIIALLIVAAGAVTAFMIIEANKPGYMSISSAAQHEMDLLNEHNWSAIIDEVSDEEMEMIFEYNKDGLLEHDIPDAATLRKTIILFCCMSENMNSMNDAKLESEKIEREKGFLIEENIQDDSYYLDSKEGIAKHWFSWKKGDGTTTNGYILLYKKDGRWFSLNGLKLSATIADAIAED